MEDVPLIVWTDLTLSTWKPIFGDIWDPDATDILSLALPPPHRAALNLRSFHQKEQNSHEHPVDYKSRPSGSR